MHHVWGVVNVRSILVFLLLFIIFHSPAQADLVGSIEGEPGVSASGASTYSFRINVLPGTAGHQPSLSIGYSSHSSNGLLGLGFTFSGFSIIQRCGTGIIQDGAFAGVDFDNEDQFCLDGEKLLAISGTYGANNTEYRTEIDTFNKVISNGTVGSGPAKFKVWTKGGQILEYGYTSDSALTIDGHVLIWAVNKVTDRAGNSYTFTYINDTDDNNLLPDRIDYTANTSAGLSADKYIKFEHEDRNDTIGKLVANKGVSLDKRVTKILNGEGTIDRKVYKITYKDRGTDPALMDYIEECYFDATQNENCLPQTDFSWQESQGDLEFNPPESLGTTNSDFNFFADVNGNGYSDHIRIKQITGPVATTTTYLRLSDGNSFGSETVVDTYSATCACSATTPFGVCTQYSCPVPRQAAFADVNADGKSDYIYTLNNAVNVRLSNGTGFGSTSTWATTVPWPTKLGLYQNFIRDIDGDGRVDWLYRHGNQIFARFSTDTSFDSPVLMDHLFQSCPQLNTTARFTPMGAVTTGGCDQWVGAIDDIDGDGRADLTITNEYLGAPTLTSVRISKGNSFHETINVDSVYQAYSGSDSHDINGDGRKDLILFQGGGQNGYGIKTSTTGTIYVRFATGLGFGAKQNFGTYTVPCAFYLNGPLGHFHDCELPAYAVGDINGDGTADVAIFNEYSVGGRKRIINLPTPDLLTQVTNGLGANVNFTYAPLSDPNVYTQGTGASFPERDIISEVPQYVVSQIATDDGIGGQQTASYHYEAARVHEHGYGNLGYAKVTAIDDATGIQSITHYRQDYPYTGQAFRTETKLSTGDLLSEADFVHGLQGTLGNGPVFPFIHSTTAKNYDFNDHALITTTTTTNQYDAYGNLEQAVVNVMDATGIYTSTINHTFKTPNTANWIIDRLEFATTSRTGGLSIAPTRSSSFEYDADGLLTKEKIEPGTGFELVRTYGRDAFGNITSETVSSNEVASRVTSTSYDGQGRFPIAVTNALNHSETRVHNDPWGGVTKLTGPNNIDTNWEYDLLGRQIKETRADNTQTNVTYAFCNGSCPSQVSSVASYKITTTVTGGATSIVYFDTLNREVLREQQSFDGSNVAIQTEYDSKGRTKRVSNPYFGSTADYWTVYSYDDLDRVTQENSPVTGVTSSAYDGLLITIINDETQIAKEQKNSIGWTISTTDDNLNVTSYDYDSQGNLLKVTDSKNNITTNTYNVRGQKTTMVDPDMGTWSYEHNMLGELISQTDAKNQTVTMLYDKLGRLTQRTEPEGITNWFYDDAFANCTKSIGKLCRVENDSGYSRTHTYDSLGRPTYINTDIVSGSYITSTSYDALGRVDDITYPSNFKVEHLYNAFGYLEKVRNANNTNEVFYTINAADQFGNITVETAGNGIVTARSYHQSTGRVQHIDSVVQDLEYKFDSLGNLTQRKDHDQTGLTENFTYDNLNRLTEANVVGVGITTFTYDNLGNITNKSDVGNYTYGNGNAGPMPLHRPVVYLTILTLMMPTAINLPGMAKPLPGRASISRRKFKKVLIQAHSHTDLIVHVINRS